MVEPFVDFMARALYAPETGYYARVREIGQKGDFYTSVSVGPAFGGLLAYWIAGKWRGAGEPEDFSVVEQGANNGQLAWDILSTLQQAAPECFAAIRYHLVEPLAPLEVWQRKILEPAFSGKCLWSPTLPVGMAKGVFLANELLDAFPVEIVRKTADGWARMGLHGGPEGPWDWEEMPMTSQLLDLVAAFPEAEYPTGWQTEACLAYQPWWAHASQMFTEYGEWLLLDYGMPAEELYARHRPQGTLRGYHQHQQLDSFPEGFIMGETDLTTHVNWTDVQRYAQEAGLETDRVVAQGSYLTNLAKPLLLATPAERKPWQGGLSEAAWVRQFLTLTHPAHLGEKFQVLGARLGAVAEDSTSTQISGA